MAGLRRWRLVRASAEAIPASVRRFNQRARQRRIRAAAPWLAALAALAVVGVAALVLTATPLFGVRTVRVRGNTVVSADQVRNAAAIAGGTPLATLDTAGVVRRVLTLPPVLHARVDRDWPSTVVITITERTAVGVLPGPDHQVDLIDANGVVFRTVPDPPPGLPHLELDTPGPDDPCTRAALSVLGSLPEKLRSRLVTLSAPAPARISLQLTGGHTIIWGDDARNDDKAQVAMLLLDRDEQVIDVSYPDLVTVR